MGDLNIDILKDDLPNSLFVNMLYSNHFLPVITKPTHFSQISNINPSLLDHIWSNKVISYPRGIILMDLTDHLPTYLKIPLETTDVHEKIKISFRVVNELNKMRFRYLVGQFEWDSLKVENVDTYADSLIDKLNGLYRESFPLKTKFISHNHSLKPWITPAINRLLRAKSQYFNLYKMGILTKSENCAYKNKIVSILRKTKINYYKHMFSVNKTNMKRTWSLINGLISKNLSNSKVKKIIVDNVEFSNDEEIAQIFNDYFCSIGTQLDFNIPHTNVDPISYVNSNINSSFYLNPVSDIEIFRIIKSLKKSKQNLNSISSLIFIENADILCSIFSDLVNTCFLTGSFPNSLKKAEVLPLHKKGDSTTLSNYRPISILPIISKIIEKCMKSRLTAFIDKYSIVNAGQFGFQRGVSTQDAILQITEQIYESLNKNSSAIGIFIDFSKAFDTINRNILLKKLEKYGIRGLPLRLLASYLENRTQAVRVGNVLSPFKQIDMGLPQGSVLAPLLFILYVNDLPCISNLFSVTLFADDATLFIEDRNYDSLIRSCNSGLELFLTWCWANRLSVNIDKTHYLIFSNKKIIDYHPVIKLNNRTKILRFFFGYRTRR